MMLADARRSFSKSPKPSLNWLLVFVPAAIIVRVSSPAGNPTILYIFSGLAIIPLAGLMGRATVELANKLGDGIGGLLNATFGNAPELIIGLMALSKGLTGIVKASIAGSIIGNLLLVLGASALAGGIKFPQQRFNQTAARTTLAALFVGAVALVIPSIFHFVAGTRPAGWNRSTAQNVSLGIALVLLIMYACVLAFSLKTHRQLFLGKANHPKRIAESGSEPWSRPNAIIVLMIATGLVALLSEFLVGTIQAARTRLGLTETFVGVIIVAIIGNAAEHTTAVQAALKNRFDLSIGIAVGSALQIALFAAPVLVLASYVIGSPMTLEFSLPEIAAVGIAAQLAFQISGNGETNWLEGVLLLLLYVIFGILFYYLPATASALVQAGNECCTMMERTRHRHRGQRRSKCPSNEGHASLVLPSLLERYRFAAHETWLAPSTFAGSVNETTHRRSRSAQLVAAACVDDLFRSG